MSRCPHCENGRVEVEVHHGPYGEAPTTQSEECPACDGTGISRCGECDEPIERCTCVTGAPV